MGVFVKHTYTKGEIIKDTLKKFLRAETKETFLKLGNELYELLENRYSETHSKEQKYICDTIIKKILPKIEERINVFQNNADKTDTYNLYMCFFKMSCRRNIRNFAFFYESFKSKKVFAKTETVLSSAFKCIDDFLSDEEIELIRLSCMPGLGKSYIANIVVALFFGNNPNDHALRITYSDDLVMTTTRQTKAIIDSQAFREVFPRYLGVEKIFKRDDSYSFTMCDSEDEYSFFAVTRDGQATGKRANLIVIDDLLKGETEANNISLQKKLTDRYDTDWTSRTDDDKLKLFMVGTMWSPQDLLNVVHERALEFDDIVPDLDLKYVEKSLDGKNIYISIPALDSRDRSTAPLRFSTEKLIKKRQQMDEYLWSAVYQQNPIAPTGLEFSYSKLKTYEKVIDLRENRNYLRKASLDPARKGKNFVSMPILYELNDCHYLVDWLFQKKPMSELYIPICNMLIKHRIQRLVLENNTDTSLKVILEEILHSKGYFDIEIIEKYSTQNKEQRIKDNRGTVVNHIYFPKKGLFPKKSDISIGMEDLTSYSFDYPNKYDDAIDSVVLYCMEFVSSLHNFASVTSFNRRKLGV